MNRPEEPKVNSAPRHLSAEEASQRSEEYFRLLVENSSDIITILNRDATVRYNSPSFERILGYSAQEFSGKYSLNLIHPEDRALLLENLKKSPLGSAGNFSVEYRLMHKDGNWRIFEGVATNLIDHPLIGGIVINSRDITERKNLEQLKDEFVQTVSHELRTPLTIIREGVSQVLDGIHGELTEKQRKFLGSAIKNMDRLGHIIEALLDVSKLEAKKMELEYEETDVAALVREVAHSCKPIAEKKGLHLTCRSAGSSNTALIDKGKVIEVLINLVNNAIKFTEKGSIEMAVKDCGLEIECRISDTGIGISKENLPRVFRKFQQFGNTAGAGEKGTGLGLAICKGIVELHGGKIKVESQTGEGSCFSFILPKKRLGSKIDGEEK